MSTLMSLLTTLTQMFGKQYACEHNPRTIKGTDTSSICKVRCFLCICVLLYTTNSQCSFPLHSLLTDAIETCGGSSRLELIKLFNCLGICTSVDTHARYVQYRVKKSVEDGAMSGYPQDALTLVSADNLDFVHGHARVYCKCKSA